MLPEHAAVPGVNAKGAGRPTLGVAGFTLAAELAILEVQNPVQDGRGSVDRANRFDAPDRVPGGSGEGRDLAVPGTDVHLAPPDCRRGIDVGPRVARPEQMPRTRAECEQRSVGVPDIDATVRDRRSRIEVLPMAESRKRLGTPPEPASPRGDGIDRAAVRPEVDQPVRVSRRTVDFVVGLELPQQPWPLSVADVERVDVVVPGAEIEDVVDEKRRRLDGAGPEAPEDPPADVAALLVPDEHRDNEPALCPGIAIAGQRLHVRGVDDVLADRGRGRRAVSEVVVPARLPRSSVDREEAAFELGDEEEPVADDGRKLERRLRSERPQLPERRPDVQLARRPRSRRVVAVRGPRHRLDALDRTLLLCGSGGDELHSRRAALLTRPGLVLVVDPSRRDRSEDQDPDNENDPAHRTAIIDAHSAPLYLRVAPTQEAVTRGCAQPQHVGARATPKYPTTRKRSRRPRDRPR